MKSYPSVDERVRFVVTEQGKLDLLTAPTCNCDVRLAGLLFQCGTCGTVYGSIRNWGERRQDRSAKGA